MGEETYLLYSTQVASGILAARLRRRDVVDTVLDIAANLCRGAALAS